MIRSFLALLLLLSSLQGVGAQQPNRLQGSASPYLLQHLYNPVDWYPWGPEALGKASAEGKLIFVSIGYSSCHWCHVMEAESFENEETAALLNAHFVSIKIDRESRPDLDEQFMVVTELLTGSGGWPNSVFLTPEGDPFFAGTYFPPEAFRTVVAQVRQAWQDDPAHVSAEAARVTAAVGGYLARKAEAQDITAEAVSRAARGLLEALDPFNGGYGVAPKFPREPLFLFLLDQAERSGDRALLEAVTAMLDGMIQGGIHDHVGGGFHRYSLDPDWHVPHFEKMLYTQALTGRLLVRAWAITGEPRYRRAAERLFDYVLRDMRDPDGAFYAAEDADSLNAAGAQVEGAFHTWTPSDLEPLGNDAHLARDVFGITGDGELEGANVLKMAALPGILAAEYRMTPSDFTMRLDGLLDRMRALRALRAAPFLDRKIVLSWNAMMIATLAEAGHRMDRPDYGKAAAEAARFVLDHMSPVSGLQRIRYDGVSEIPGQLPDYAALGLALVALHDFAPHPAAARDWLQRANALAQEIRARFGKAETGYRMTEVPDGLTEIIPVDDTEIPSGNALALSLFARLSHRSLTPELELDGFRLAAALGGQAMQRPGTRAFALKAIQELQHGETGPVRHAAKGAVRVSMLHDPGSGIAEFAISIADGWHINAHQPLDNYFVATDLTVTGGSAPSVDYPEPVIKSLAISGQPLALYEGNLRLAVKPGASEPGQAPRRAILTVQACSDEICLQPEQLSFAIW